MCEISNDESDDEWLLMSECEWVRKLGRGMESVMGKRSLGRMKSGE